MTIKTLYANKNSYSNKNGVPVERDFDSIKYIVIHYTGNKGDTAKNNATYFANSNTRSAGAHFFVDQNGEIYKSCKIKWIAWSVGGVYTKQSNGSTYYGKCTNANSISIELCDISDKDPSKNQIKATNELIKYIKEKCPNAKTVIRHFDVNSKICPSRFIDNDKWKALKKKITK